MNNKHSCGGEWIPIPGWAGRYQCDNCLAIGLKERLVNGGNRGTESIRAYICKHSGCSEPATHKHYQKPRARQLFCWAHGGEKMS